MASKTEKAMKEAGFKFGFGMGKPTSNIMEGIRRRLSKTGLSAADRKKLKQLETEQQKRDASKTAGERAAKAKMSAAEKAEKAKRAKKTKVKDSAPMSKVSGAKIASMKSKVKDTAPKGKGGKAANIMSKVKDKAPMGKGTPKNVGAAQKAGSMFFFKKNKDGSQTKMLAVTAEQKKKLGMSLTAIANKYKGKDGMKRMLADLKKKKMAMGGAMMKKKGMAMGGFMKKKGMAMGGMKKKGYAMGGLKATNPSQVGLRKLPSNVRNKMGYMKKGGMTKKGYAKGGSMKKKGYAMGGMTKKYGVVDNRKTKR